MAADRLPALASRTTLDCAKPTGPMLKHSEQQASKNGCGTGLASAFRTGATYFSTACAKSPSDWAFEIVSPGFTTMRPEAVVIPMPMVQTPTKSL